MRSLVTKALLLTALLCPATHLLGAATRSPTRAVPTWADLADEDIRGPWKSVTVLEDGGIAIATATADLPAWATSNLDAYKVAVQDLTGGGKWVRHLDGYVLASWFGATGDGTTNDRDALQAAMDFCRRNGFELRLSAGVYSVVTATWNVTTHAVDYSYLNLNNSTADNQSLTITGDGIGQTVIQEAAGTLQSVLGAALLDVGLSATNAARNIALFEWNYTDPVVGDFDMGTTVLRGMTLDKNARSNTNAFDIITGEGGTPDEWRYEQTHIVKLGPDTNTPNDNSLGRWVFENVQLYDKTGGGISDSAYLNNFDSITARHVIATESDSPTIVADANWGERADIEFAGSVGKYLIDDCDVRYCQIEPSVASTQTYQRHNDLSDSRFDILELTELIGNDDAGQYTWFTLNGVTVRTLLTMRGCNFNIVNSWLKVADADGQVQYPYRLQAANTHFALWCSDGTDADGFYWGNPGTLKSWAPQAKFVNCDFLWDYSGAITPATSDYPIYSASFLEADAGEITLDNCRFDERGYGTFQAYRGGKWRIRNCYISGTTRGINAGSDATYYSDVRTYDCTFDDSTTYNVYLNDTGTATYLFEIHGSIPLSGWAYGNSQADPSNVLATKYRVHPHFLSDTVPASGKWFQGDIVEKITKVDGSNWGWIATTGGSSPVWAPYGATRTTVAAGAPSGGEYAPDLLSASVFTVSMGGDLTLIDATGVAAGRSVELAIYNDQVGAQTLTLNTTDWPCVGQASPITVPAGKWVFVTLRALGSAQTDVQCAAALQNN